MPALTLDQGSQALFVPGAGPVLIVNTDTADTVYIGPQQSISVSDVAVPPQGSVTLDGAARWWGSTCDPSTVVQVLLLPGGLAWDNPVGVQVALSALGLAKDSSVQAVNTSVGGTNTQLGAGVAPAVAGIFSKSLIKQAPSVNPIYTMAADGRLWAAKVSAAAASDVSFGTGTSSQYAQIITASGLTLDITEIAIAGSNEVDSNDGGMPYNGLPLAAGDVISLDVNNGVAPTNIVVRGSAFVVVSIP